MRSPAIRAGRPAPSAAPVSSNSRRFIVPPPRENMLIGVDTLASGGAASKQHRRIGRALRKGRAGTRFLPPSGFSHCRAAGYESPPYLARTVIALGSPGLAHRGGAAEVLLLAGLLAGLEAADLVVDDLLVGLEGADRGRLAGEAQLLPAAGHAVVHVLAQRRALAEDGQVAVLLAGVDERLGAVGPLLGRVLGRIEPGAPGVAQDVDVLDGV